MPIKYIDQNGLLYLWQKIKDKFVKRELKTGSTTEYKVLSDNNLTDALKIKIDAPAFVEKDPTVPAWAKAAAKPAYTKAEVGLGSVDNTADAAKPVSAAQKTALDLKADKTAIPTKTSQLTNDSAFQTAAQVTTTVNAAVSGAYKYKGSKATVALLPTTGNAVGDVWNVDATGMNYAWTGTEWDELGSLVDLTGFVKTEDLVAITNAEIDAIVAA